MELAERDQDADGLLSAIVTVPYDEVYGQGIEDMLHRIPAIEKIGGTIGWAPEHDLERILGDVIEYVRHQPVALEAV